MNKCFWDSSVNFDDNVSNTLEFSSANLQNDDMVSVLTSEINKIDCITSYVKQSTNNYKNIHKENIVWKYLWNQRKPKAS